MSGIFFKYRKVNYPSDKLYLYSLDSNLNVDWNTVQLTNISHSIAFNSITELVYVNVNSALKAYDNTGNIEYTVSSTYIPIIVDNLGFVWTLSYKGNKIRKYTDDLTSYTEYTLKVGNPLNDVIFDFVLSKDETALFLCGGHASHPNTVAKYEIANLDGGDETWSATDTLLGAFIAAIIDIDNDDNVYVGNDGTAYGGNEDVTVSLDANGNRRWRISDCAYGALVVAKTSEKLFVTDYDYLRQFDFDGNLIAETKRYPTSGYPGYFRYLSIYDDEETQLLAGMRGASSSLPTDQGIYLMDISTNWTPGGDPSLDTFRIGYGSYMFRGDPTGYKSKYYLREPGNSYKFFEEAPLIESKNKAVTVPLLNNLGRLIITEQDFVLSTLLQPSASLTISKDVGFKLNKVNIKRQIMATENDFVITEDSDLNISIKPCSENKILESVTEDITLQKEYV